MATIAITTSSVTIGITTLSPVSSISSNINEPIFTNAFSVITTTLQQETKSTSLSNGLLLMPTYAKTDGVPITTSGSSSGTYWVTG